MTDDRFTPHESVTLCVACTFSTLGLNLSSTDACSRPVWAVGAVLCISGLYPVDASSAKSISRQSHTSPVKCTVTHSQLRSPSLACLGADPTARWCWFSNLDWGQIHLSGPQCPHLHSGDDAISPNTMPLFWGLAELKHLQHLLQALAQSKSLARYSNSPKKQNGAESKEFCIHKQPRMKNMRKIIQACTLLLLQTPPVPVIGRCPQGVTSSSDSNRICENPRYCRNLWLHTRQRCVVLGSSCLGFCYISWSFFVVTGMRFIPGSLCTQTLWSPALMTPAEPNSGEEPHSAAAISFHFHWKIGKF